MIDFHKELKKHLVDSFLPSLVGVDTDLTEPAKSFSDHLYAQDLDSLPFVVVNIRSSSADQTEGEIGNPYDLTTYETHIYYLDMCDDYVEGDDRRDTILGRLEKKLKLNRKLGNFEVTDADSREYVYDSQISSITFDYSGQEGDYSFVSELYLTVYTAQSKL